MNNSLSLFNICSWGFTISISSILFTYIGRQMDVAFNTEPQFMIGLLILAVSMSIMRLYKDAISKKDKV
jgi:F0F1-type ATP synthase assembly protein I